MTMGLLKVAPIEGSRSEYDPLWAGLADEIALLPRGGAAEPRPEALVHQRLFTLTPAQCVAAPARTYLIKGFLCAKDHAALIGHPGSGKSTLMPWIGYRLSLGLDVFGHRTRATTVLYIAAEDAEGIKARVCALRSVYGDSPRFLVQPVPVNFKDSAIDKAHTEALIREHQPGLIIIDTLAAAFPGLQENEASGMGLVIQVARDFTRVSEAAVISIHHPPKETIGARGAAMTPRGSGALLGDLDGMWVIDRRGNDLRTMTVSKNRNGAANLVFTFRLVGHDLGTDDEGDAITAPLAEPANNAPPDRLAGLSVTQRGAMHVLERLIESDGVPMPDRTGFPRQGSGVPQANWIAKCEEAGLSKCTDIKDRRKAIKNIIENLICRKLVNACNGVAWVPASQEVGEEVE